MANTNKKLEQGLQHMHEAEKCMKTSFLKWKPDLDGAAAEYQKAATAFKNAKAYEKAAVGYLKCADVQREGGSAFHAAKSLEAAALMYKEMKNFDRAADLVEKASNLYLEHGTPDTAAIALERAAKMIENSRPDRAVALYVKACDVADNEDNIRQCAEMIGRAARLLIRQRKYEEAADALQREMNFYAQVENHGMINKLVMGLVMVHLQQGDSVAADQAFKKSTSYSGFAESEEAAGISRLLDAYEEGDQEAAYAELHSPLFRHMENDFTKLARAIRVPGGKTSLSGEGVASAAGGGVNEDEDDEFAGGLC